MPSVGYSLAPFTAAALTCFVPDMRVGVDRLLHKPFPFWVVSRLFTKPAPLESESLQERIDRRGSDRGDGGEINLAVAEVHPGTGRSGGRAARNIIRDDARLLDDVALVLPTKKERSPMHAIRKRANSSLDGVWW